MLEVENLVKIYKTKGGVTVKALDNVSLQFPEKGMIFLLGKSGSGKSTLLNVIGGLDKPDSGEIIIKGKNSKTFSGADFDSYRNTYIGFIFQEYNILDEFNIEQNISLALQLQGKPNDKKAVEAILEQVDLVGFGKRKPNTLSGGQKQRVAIARALIKDPEIIMADEPTGALDSNTGKQVFDTLKKLSQDKLVIIVSHDRDFAEHYADRIIELSDGKIISDVSKEYVSPVTFNTNINIVNNNTVTIKDTSKLTSHDMEEILNVLKGHEGQAIISANEQTLPSIRQTLHMSEDGSSEIFEDTKEVKVNEYDGSKTKFIRSHLPFARAFKMGASSLKTKPVRLIFTMLLNIVALVMFGLTSTLMLFDESYSVSEALKKSEYTTEAVRKEYKSSYHNIQINNSTGEKKETYSYDTYNPAFFTQDEVDRYNKDGLNYAGVITFAKAYQYNSRVMNIREINQAGLTPYYRVMTGLTGFIDVNENYLTQNDMRIINGTMPSNVDEIVLPDYIAQAYIIGDKHDDITNNEELIGKPVTIYLYTNKGSGELNLTVSGVYFSGNIPTRYEDLKKDDGSLSDDQTRKLGEALKGLLDNSYHTFGVVHPDFFITHKNTFMEKNDIYSDLSNYSSNVRGLYIDTMLYDQSYIPSIESAYSYVFDNDLASLASSLSFYDRTNKSMEYSALNEKEIYLSRQRYYSEYREYMRKQFDEQLLQTFSDDARRYTEALRNLTSDENEAIKSNIERIKVNEIYNSNLGELSEASKEYIRGLDTAYYREYAKRKYQYSMIQDMKTYGGIEDGYSKTDFEQWRNKTYSVDTNPDAYDFSAMPELEDFLTNDPYHYLEHGCLYHAFSRLWQYKEENPALFELVESYNSGALLPSSEEWTQIKAFALSHGYEESFFHYDANYQKGFDFDYEFDHPYYYYSYKGLNGQLIVKGFYDNGDSYSGQLVINDNFAKSYGVLDDYSNKTVVETDYQETFEDSKYSFIITKSSFSQNEVKNMLKDYGPYRLRMTDGTYLNMLLVLSLVETLKTVFLIIGIVCGSFAALLLFNFISTSIASKTKEIGILRAVGARGSDLFKIFFSESGLVSAICVAIAVVISIFVSIQLNISMAAEVGISILNFGFINIGIIAAGALVIAFLGTFLPVLLASRKPPVESIRTL